MNDDMPIKALAPWFGGKRNLAPLIVKELGDHRCYWEPFAGGMSIIMVKPPCQHEYLNDLHGDLINLARVVADPKLGPRLYRRLRRSWMMEELQKECRAALKAEADPLDRAFAYFVESWMGRNGVAGTHSSSACFCIRYTGGGGAAAVRYRHAVESIPAWRRRMRNIAISNRDAFEMLEKIEDAPGVAIYCDPPYIVKGAKYLHDFGRDDHAHLALLLARFKRTRVVVSYYADPALKEMYTDWTHVHVVVNKAMAHPNSREKNSTKATEVLLINGPSYTQGEASLLGEPHA
jgi:DNA adenine methylase